MSTIRLLQAVSLAILLTPQAISARPEWKRIAGKPDDWFRSEEGRQTARNVLSHQSPRGDWPKGVETTARMFNGDRSKIEGTFDNRATVDEIRFLARAYNATGETSYRAAVLKAIDHVLEAQYPTGGWPQFSPPGKGYHRYITFNDDTMVHLLELLREVESSDRFAFVDDIRRAKARAAFRSGIACILKCQVIVNGKKTAWCAQHDEKTLEPRPARTFEPVSLSGSESVGILELLMSLDRPDQDVVEAVRAGAAWFKEVALKGIRQTTVDGDKVIVDDPSAPPLWARFYEIGTNRPIFCSRDGVVRYSMAEISRERRLGYGWYGDRAKLMLERSNAWLQRHSSHSWS